VELLVGFSKNPPNEKDHLRVVHAMKESMIVIGDFLAQKVIFTATTAGVQLPLAFFNNCRPGLAKHIKELKKQLSNFRQTKQVRQVVTFFWERETCERKCGGNRLPDIER
jgi:hypothetical protein